MRVAINLVKDGAAQACVSAGNTGALMAISRFVLKTLPGIDRPAIASQLPTRTGVTTVLDLGANVNCTPEQLVQFAVMGSALVAAVDGIERPDASACSTSAKRTSRATTSSSRPRSCCKASALNFYGNVEGDDIYKGTTDVVVCDGFVGNVALKTSEGLAHDALRLPARGIHAQSADASCCGCSRCRCSRRSSGASIRAATTARRCSACKGIVVKSHGSADVFAFRHALQKAHAEARARRARAHRAAASRRCRCRRAPSRRRHAAPIVPMHSRIAGTGGYLPAQIVTNDDLAQRIDTERRVDAHAHRHPPAPHRRRRRADAAISRCAAAQRGARGGGHRAGRRRSDHRRDDDARHGLSVDGVHPAGQARRDAAAPAFDVQAVCSGFVYALAIADRMVGQRRGAERAGRRRRNLFAHPRLERSRHLRAVRRRRRRRRARAVGRRRASCRRTCTPTAAIATSCRVPGSVARRRGQRHAVPAHGRARRCSSSRSRCSPKSAQEALARNRHGGGRHRLADSAPGEHPHHGSDGEEARPAARAHGRRPSTATPTRRRRRFRWRSTWRCATAASSAGQHVMLLGVGGGFTWGAVAACDW